MEAPKTNEKGKTEKQGMRKITEKREKGSKMSPRGSSKRDIKTTKNGESEKLGFAEVMGTRSVFNPTMPKSHQIGNPLHLIHRPLDHIDYMWNERRVDGVQLRNVAKISYISNSTKRK